MVRSLVGAALAALLAALAGALCLTAAHLASPTVTLSLDRAATRVLSGFYGLERSGELTFAWTGPRATVTLPGLNRQVPWRCGVRLRGARAAGIAQPTVAIDVDGVPAARVTATNEFVDIPVDVTTHDRSNGLVLTIAAAPTFVPAADPRALGVQVDEIACAPADAAGWPPRQGLQVAAIAAAIVALGGVALGAPLWLALLAATVVAAAQGCALATGLALYTPGLARVPWLAGVPMTVAALAGWAIAWRSGRRASAEARVALAYSAIALYLLLLALLHPSKATVDAQFHAHRLEWVHAGRYFFTQPMPSGVAFPYAIGLYVVSLPWMALTRDHVALLRVVVCATHVLTGLLLYVAVTRRWSDRLGGTLAIVLWSLVPQWFVVVGNANLTGAFAQSIATATLLSAALLLPGRGTLWQVVALFVLASLAFLSHVGTFPLLAVALMFAAALHWWRGERTERATAGWLAAITVTAAIVSVATYYGHFTEVYRSLDRVTGRAAVVQAGPQPAPATAATPPVWTRGATAAALAVQAVGWPIALLALAGAWTVVRTRPRDRLTLTLLAWFGACAVFLAFGTLGPVAPAFYRYTVEFISRVVFASWPAAIVLAGAGGAWAWRAGPIGRVTSIALVCLAVWLGARSWWSWIG